MGGLNVLVEILELTALKLLYDVANPEAVLRLILLLENEYTDCTFESVVVPSFCAATYTAKLSPGFAFTDQVIADPVFTLIVIDCMVISEEAKVGKGKPRLASV